jgi:hypothetical protein
LVTHLLVVVSVVITMVLTAGQLAALAVVLTAIQPLLVVQETQEATLQLKVIQAELLHLLQEQVQEAAVAVLQL